MGHDVIRIKNAQIYAYHGVEIGEQKLGGKFEVDVDLRCDLSRAMVSDSLSETLDYEAVYSVILNAVTAKKYHLLEALANTIANHLLANFTTVSSLTIRVRKPHPPVKGVVDHVEVEITKQRI